jgi:hypothetical protein
MTSWTLKSSPTSIRSDRGSRRKAGIADDYFSTPPPLLRVEDYRDADRCLRRAAVCPELLDPWD